MNYIKHLTGFFDKASRDYQLNATHISVYVSLFQLWNASRFQNPISISRSEVMKISKIASNATYHKCIRELHASGYFSYQPSYNSLKGSLVYMFSFETADEQTTLKRGRVIDNTGHVQPSYLKREPGDEQALVGSRAKNESGFKQALVPYINSLNSNKLKTKENEHENTHANLPEYHFFEQAGEEITNAANSKGPAAKKEKLREKKKGEPEGEGELAGSASGFKRPVLQAVKEHFAFQNWPEQEAGRFFNHYQSNGWLVGGKTPMRDWQASAGNWMMNVDIFKLQKNVRALNGQVNNDKDYSEPL